MKKCNRCSCLKNLNEFYKNSAASDGLKSICKICVSDTAKNYYDSNVEKMRAVSKKHYLQNKEVVNKRSRDNYRNNPELKIQNRLRPYNLDKDGLDKLLKECDYKCNICKITEKEHIEIYNRVLYIDHCHKTKIVRGLLCHKCNLALGYFVDNIDYLEEAIKYLNKNKK